MEIEHIKSMYEKNVNDLCQLFIVSKKKKNWEFVQMKDEHG